MNYLSAHPPWPSNENLANFTPYGGDYVREDPIFIRIFESEFRGGDQSLYVMRTFEAQMNHFFSFSTWDFWEETSPWGVVDAGNTMKLILETVCVCTYVLVVDCGEEIYRGIVFHLLGIPAFDQAAKLTVAVMKRNRQKDKIAKVFLILFNMADTLLTISMRVLTNSIMSCNYRIDHEIVFFPFFQVNEKCKAITQWWEWALEKLRTKVMSDFKLYPNLAEDVKSHLEGENEKDTYDLISSGALSGGRR